MILPMEKDPLIIAAAKARLVAPPILAAVHYSSSLAQPKRYFDFYSLILTL
jgi:hypothetical protein